MNTEELLAAGRKLRVLIAGDICLDRWCSYAPCFREPSRETGIPRQAVVSVQSTPGAGGTIANNLTALGSEAITCLSVIGDDGYGFELCRELSIRRISAELILRSPLVQTFTYTKLINAETGAEDQPRVDFINTCSLPSELDDEVCRLLKEYGHLFDVIIVSDQAETDAGGVITPQFRKTLAELAASHTQAVIWVDSRARAEHFRGITLKVNQQEAEEASIRMFGSVDFAKFRRETRSPALFVTHGARGVLVVEPDGERWVSSKPIENPVDICGAGDSFSAGAAIVYAITRSAMEAAEFGNRIAGITIMKSGTGTASSEEMLAAE